MTTPHDRAVLNAVLNPLMPAGELFVDTEDHAENALVDEEEDTDACRAAKRLEVEGVKAADSGDLRTALEFFSRAVELAPQRAAGYNNRAQALRLADDDVGALVDLESAIRLSCGRGRTGCQALTQRGCIMRRLGRDDEARRDFEAAAELGSPFAKTQAVQMNPYAALCNKMLHNVVEKLRKPQESSEPRVV